MLSKTKERSIVYLRLVFSRIYALIAALLFGVASKVKSTKTSTDKEVREIRG